MILLTLIAIIFLAFYFYVKNCHNYWRKRQIPTLKPTFLLGNIKETLLGRENFLVPMTQAYNQFKDYKYVGFYKCLSPTLILIDPEVIGNVLVKDFTHFEDNAVEVSEEADMLMGRNLFVLKGQHWKYIKSLVSPMFTSGKLKYVFPLMEETSSKLVNYITKRIDQGRNIAMDGKYLAHQFTTENVASCTFGLDAQAFHKNSEFVHAARQLGLPSFIQALKFNLVFMVPSLGKFLSLSFFTKEVQNYLLDVVKQTLNYRKDNNIVRNDYLDMICQLKEKSTEYVFNDKDVTAQAAAFFGDGIETSAVLLSYCLFELAQNPDVLQQLRDEIEDVKQNHNKKITYEGIIEMEYLDCVINETLRLHVPLMTLFKTCTKQYEFPPPKDGIPGVTLYPGDTILIPVEGLHRDEEYFPEPNKFIPERFNKENKSNIRNFTYLPFGEGPRFCVGLRFGILQIKLALISIVTNFEVNVNEKMKVPLGLDPGTFLRMPVGGFWFDFHKIKK